LIQEMFQFPLYSCVGVYRRRPLRFKIGHVRLSQKQPTKRYIQEKSVFLSFTVQKSSRLERRLKMIILITQKMIPLAILLFMTIFWILGILNLVWSHSKGPEHAC